MAGKRMTKAEKARADARLGKLKKRVATDPETRRKVEAGRKRAEGIRAEAAEKRATSARKHKAAKGFASAKKAKSKFDEENKGALKGRKRGQAASKFLDKIFVSAKERKEKQKQILAGNAKFNESRRRKRAARKK